MLFHSFLAFILVSRNLIFYFNFHVVMLLLLKIEFYED